MVDYGINSGLEFRFVVSWEVCKGFEDMLCISGESKSS